jgi:cation diffusion facilitator CzcD-associated flavoprotein CzcO
VTFVSTVIIGAGQSGLAMSKHLTDRSIDHVLLERAEVANSWQTERWDSLRLLTPNWQSRLPGFAYAGGDPDGYMRMPEVVGYLQDYARAIRAPVRTGVREPHGRRLRRHDRPAELALPRAGDRQRRLQHSDDPCACERPAAIDRVPDGDGLPQSVAVA